MFERQDLLARYAVADRQQVHLRVNFVTSLDGAATHDGLSGGLNNPADQQVFHTLRMLSDVVLVGAGTVRAEGYEDLRLDDDAAAWRVEQGWTPHPVMAVISGALNLDPAAPIFTRAPRRTLVLTHAAAPPEQSEELAEVADVIDCGATAVRPQRVKEVLANRGLAQILSEGGPTWFGTMVAEDVVDELCLTLSPLLEAGPATRIARSAGQHTRQMTLASVLRASDMLLLRYLRA